MGYEGAPLIAKLEEAFLSAAGRADGYSDIAGGAGGSCWGRGSIHFRAGCNGLSSPAPRCATVSL